MASILVQTTVAPEAGESYVQRFAELVFLLRRAGHSVRARDRTPRRDGTDPVLAQLHESSYDQLWLFAADNGDGLSPADVRGILRFRERGGGLFTARDRENLGVSLLNLGAVGLAHHFTRYNRQRSRDSARGNYRALRGGGLQRALPTQPVHELLFSARSMSGIIDYFPAHPHEAPISLPPYTPSARVVAVAATPDGEPFNLAVAIDRERCVDGELCGRAIAAASLHYFTNESLAQLDDERAAAFTDFAVNAARWLSEEP